MNITSGKITKAKKVVVYGPEGVGKTTFASRFPNPLFSDTENSTINYDVQRFDKPSSWTMLLQQAKYIKDNPSICETYVIDTADWAERLCSEHICSKAKVNGIEDFGYGKGYVYLEEEFGRFLNLLEDIWELGINLVVTAHAEIKKIEQPEEIGGYDHWQMKLEKKTMPLLKEWADLLIFANYKVFVVNVDNQGAAKGKNKVQGGNRVMYTTRTPWWDAKNRDNLSDELPFDFAEIAHLIPSKNQTTEPVAIKKDKKQIDSKTVEEVIFYWHHPESDSLFITKNSTMEEIEKLTNDGTEMLTKEEFEILQNVEKAIEKTTEKTKSELDNLPITLRDLMKSNNVLITEIQEVVSNRGYYPKDTPISNYDADFINGVLVGAWEQVYQMIKDLRFKESNNIPF